MDKRALLVETFYRLDVTEDEHVRLMQEAAEQCWRQTRGGVVSRATASKEGALNGAGIFFSPTDSFDYEAIARRVYRTVPSEEVQSMLCMSPMYGSASEAERLGAFRNGEVMRQFRRYGLADSLGMYCSTLEGAIIGVMAFLGETYEPSDAERAYWQPAASHLMVAWRLRQRFESGVEPGDIVDAVFRPDGRVCDAPRALPKTVLQRLREHVRRRESLRLGQVGSELWEELIGGRWTLLDKYEADGRRIVLAVRNAAAGADLCRLTSREVEALSMARKGAANKEIALTLGVSAATATRLLASVSRKLRGSLADILTCIGTEDANAQTAQRCVMAIGRSELLLATTPELPALQVSLSISEREIVAAALRGASNREISLARGTSVRTVANQLASAFEKLGVRSRRELASRVAGFGD